MVSPDSLVSMSVGRFCAAGWRVLFCRGWALYPVSVLRLGRELLSLPPGLLAIGGQRYLCRIMYPIYICGTVYSVCVWGGLEMPRASWLSVTPTLSSPDPATHRDASEVHLWQAHPGQAGEVLHEERRGLGAHLWSPEWHHLSSTPIPVR